MKKLNYGVILALTAALTSCSMFKSTSPSQQQQPGATPKSTQAQTEQRNKAAFDKANSLTTGWPQASITAAREMIEKHGDPQEVTSEELIWRNVAPFKKIVVHKTVYNHKFPLLHQNSLEHVVDYRAPVAKIDDIWRYNGSVVLDRTKGEMSSFSNTEAGNILALNLAHDVMIGKRGSENARVTYGKETLDYLNGKKTAMTQVLTFGGQYETADAGESVTNKIRWQGLEPRRAPTTTQPATLRQAEEERPKTKK